MAGLVFQNLKDSASVDFPDIFLVEVLGQIGIVDLVGSVPLDLILLQPVGIGKNLFPKGALKIKMLLSDLRLMVIKIGIFDLIEVLDCLKMEGSSGISHSFLILFVGFVDLCVYSWFSHVVEES